MADAPYFARVAEVLPSGDGVDVKVENTGTETLPVGWVRLSGTIQPAGSSTTTELARADSTVAIEKGTSAIAAHWSLAGIPDGPYFVYVHMWVIDSDGNERCSHTGDGVLELAGGHASRYRDDEHAYYETGTEFTGGKQPQSRDHDFGWDPRPYLDSDGKLLATVVNRGALPIPRGSKMKLSFDDEQSGDVTVEVDRDVASGDSFSATFDLPDRDAGNHEASVDLDVETPEMTTGSTTAITVCYQEYGPQDVLYR